MSYILDALKKSERERAASRTRGAATSGETALPHAPLIALAVGILGAAAAGTWWGLASQTPEPVATPVTAATPLPDPEPVSVATAPASAVAAPIHDLAEHTEPTSPAPSPVAALAPPTGDVPFLHALPPELQRTIPPMAVNIHVYAADEANHLLYINNRQCRRGDTIEGGVVVEGIVPDGVVLRYQGTRFKLPRPS